MVDGREMQEGEEFPTGQLLLCPQTNCESFNCGEDFLISEPDKA